MSLRPHDQRPRDAIGAGGHAALLVEKALQGVSIVRNAVADRPTLFLVDHVIVSFYHRSPVRATNKTTNAADPSRDQRRRRCSLLLVLANKSRRLTRELDMPRIGRRDRLALDGLEERRPDAASRALARSPATSSLLRHHARVRRWRSSAARVCGP